MPTYLGIRTLASFRISKIKRGEKHFEAGRERYALYTAYDGQQKVERNNLQMEKLRRHERRRQKYRDSERHEPNSSRHVRAVIVLVIVLGGLEIFKENVRRGYDYGRAVHDYPHAPFKSFAQRISGFFRSARLLKNRSFVVGYYLRHVRRVGICRSISIFLFFSYFLTSESSAMELRYTSEISVCVYLPALKFSTFKNLLFILLRTSERFVFMFSVKPSRGPLTTVEVGGSAIARLSNFFHVYRKRERRFVEKV